MRVLVGLGVVVVLLSGCAPPLPGGVTKAALDSAITSGIGDPNSCVLISRAGKVAYRYGSNVVCGKAWPACTESATRTPAQVLKSPRGPLATSCASSPDGSRSVSWSAGAVPGHLDLSYAAVMEGPSVPPGIVVTDKLAVAFKRAGL